LLLPGVTVLAVPHPVLISGIATTVPDVEAVLVRDEVGETAEDVPQPVMIKTHTSRSNMTPT